MPAVVSSDNGVMVVVPCGGRELNAENTVIRIVMMIIVVDLQC